MDEKLTRIWILNKWGSEKFVKKWMFEMQNLENTWKDEIFNPERSSMEVLT